ncbi:MAG TPA: NAD(P)H-dependent oxidoreductase [Povalibacter sp.]|jgi:chromate reductase, NAD(P)H dehydrogenase (quinone)
MQQKKVGVIVGSLRKGAYTRLMSQALVDLAPPSLTLSEIGIGDLPFYNQDLETDQPPAAWTVFRQRVIASDAILFVTPEYNRSMPGAVKNALDVGSRPWGHSAWSGKPAAVISTTPGALGGMAANHHLRQVVMAVNLAAMPYPEAYIPAVATLFDENDQLQNADTRKFMTDFLQSFADWIDKFKPGK